jgi:hypothetical protein
MVSSRRRRRPSNHEGGRMDISAPILPLRASVKMRPMTEARSVAQWSGVPRFSQPLLEALLRLIAMLWSNVAQLFRMRPSRRRGECHTSAMPQALPAKRRDNQEIKPASARSDHKVLHRTAGEVDRRVFAARRRGKPRAPLPPPASPAKAGAQSSSGKTPGKARPYSDSALSALAWIPAFAGNAAHRAELNAEA